MFGEFQTAYQKILNPKSIVVVGASNNMSKPGGSIVKNIVAHDFSGELHLVNKNGDSVHGMSAYSDVRDLPNGIDLGIIVIPANGVYDTMKILNEKNCNTIIVLTAGFGETDEAGREAEQKLVALAQEKCMTMFGPNCLGIVNPHYRGKFAGIQPVAEKGSIDVISASGATVDYVIEQANLRGLKFDNIISMGNSAQNGVEDMLELLDETHSSESAPVKMLYMESIKKPEKLLKHSRSLTRKGCIFVGVKSGVTDDGKRAAASHTGALATSDTAVQALFDKAGIIRVRSKYELVELGCALTALKGKNKVQKIGIITDAGGPGVMLTDELNKYGLTIPRLKESTQKKIAEFLPKFATINNPVDCLPTQTGQQIAQVIKTMAEEKENIDAIVVLTGNSMLMDKWESYSAIIKCMETSPIPVIPVLSSVSTCKNLIEKFIDQDKTFFVDEVNVGKALGQLYHRKPVYESEDALPGYDKNRLAGLLANGFTGALPADICTDILDAAGLKRPRQIVIYKRAELEKRARDLVFPMVAKIIGPLHKSDMGGVIVGINSDDELIAAWIKFSEMPQFEGMLLQEMIIGNEIIIGAKKEPGYGHLVMFGLGGIFTEALKDNIFALAPLSLKESENIIRSIRAIKILEGARNQKGMSIALLADYLTKISMLVRDFPQISEIDLNPIKGEGENLCVVDCRIIVYKPSKKRRNWHDYRH